MDALHEYIQFMCDLWFECTFEDHINRCEPMTHKRHGSFSKYACALLCVCVGVCVSVCVFVSKFLWSSR